MVDCCCCNPPPRRCDRRSIRPVAVPVVVPGDHCQMSDATMKEGHERRAVALPPPRCRRQAAADLALSRCHHRCRCRRGHRAAAAKLPPTSRCRAATTAAAIRWLVVALLYAVQFCHRMPSWSQLATPRCSSLPPSGRPQKSCPKGAGRIIRVPDLRGQTGVLLKDAFRHK